MTNYSFFRHVALVFSVFLISNLSSLQAQVGIGTTNPDSNAALDINGTEGGLLMPRMALTDTGSPNPLGAHVTGMTVYNTATSGSGATQVTPGFYFNDGTRWVRISGSSDPKTAWELAGNAGTNPTDNFLGTTDNVPLRIRTNNSNRFEFTTDGQIRANGNGTASAPTYSWTANNRNNSGMYSPENNQLGFSTGGGNRLLVTNDYIQSIQNHRFANGTASNPSITFTDNTGTGFWRPGENILATSTNGAERMRVLANGRIGINTPNPSEQLHTVGNFRLQGAFMPNNQAGDPGRVLISNGANSSPQWGANLETVNAITRYVTNGINIPAATINSITVTVPGLTTGATAIINIQGNWSEDIFDDITIHNIEVRTGEVRFGVTNNTGGFFGGGTDYPGMVFNVTIIR